MTPRVIDAQYQNAYIIRLTFSNNECRTIDVSPFLTFGVFKKLADLDVFKQFHVAYGTLEWPGGIDLDPEFVWEKSTALPS